MAESTSIFVGMDCSRVRWGPLRKELMLTMLQILEVLNSFNFTVENTGILDCKFLNSPAAFQSDGTPTVDQLPDLSSNEWQCIASLSNDLQE